MEVSLSNKGRFEKITYTMVLIFSNIYMVACFFLYYMQSIQPLDYNNRYYQSDLPYHISMIVDDGWYYSFTAYAYKLLYTLGGGKTILIALLLAVMTQGTFFLTESLLRKLFQIKKRCAFTMGSALVLQFMMPFYVKQVGQYRYVSYQAGNLWHNSTYICMRFFSLLAVYMFMELAEDYKKELNGKKLGLFCLNLAVCTGIKPSFLTVFAPIMALKLLYDLCKKVPFKNIFIFGCTVLPACLVMLWQNMVLFGDDTGNGFEIRPFATFSLHADRPKVAVLCSIAFPLVVLGFFFLLRIVKGKQTILQMFGEREYNTYIYYWFVTIFGFILALCLTETGKRANDGNFLWGYSIAIFLIQIFSFYIFRVEIGKRKALKLKAGLETAVYRAMIVIETLVLFYQLYCGLYFFLRLMEGETYFMQV